MTEIDDDDAVYRIAYDCERRKVGCVLIQAALGSTLPNDLFFKYFSDPNSWLISITDDMKVYPITDEQLPILAAQTDFTSDFTRAP